MLSRGAGTHRERLPARPGTAPAGISVERKPRAQLEGSLEGHLEGDSSSEDEELEPGSEDESFEEEPEVFPRSPSPGTPTPPKALAAPAEAVPPVPPPPADAGDLELRHEAATVNLAEAPSASVQAGHSEDDEFDYAFTGAAREAPGHVETFKAAPLPAHLVSDTKGLLREEALLEEGDEEEESESEEVEAEAGEGAELGEGAAGEPGDAGGDAGAADPSREGGVWAQANAGFREEERLRAAAHERAQSRTIANFREALRELSAVDLAAERKAAVVWVPPEPSFLARCFPCLGGSDEDPLQESLWPERETLFALAKLPFCDAAEAHLPLLRAVYRGLSGSTEAHCGRTGAHWEAVGFQGPDPTTDLRGCGMLGLLFLLRLAEEAGAECQRFDFPTPLVALHCTKWTLESLRGGRLSAACNSKGEVAPVAEGFFLGAFAEFRRRWGQSAEPGTESESFGLRMERAGRVLGEAGAFAKSRAADVARGGWSAGGSAGGGGQAVTAPSKKKKKKAPPPKKKLPSLQLTDLSAL